MPLYEFECESCGTRFEKIQKFTDPTPEVCPHCSKGPVKKLFSSPAIQFKGSGFYITDYAKKSSSAGSESSSEASSSSTSESKSSDTKSTESTTKPAAKTDTKD